MCFIFYKLPCVHVLSLQKFLRVFSSISSTLVPTPTLVLSRDPDAGVTLRHGDTATLICTIQLESGVVDSNVTVVGSLCGPGSTPMNSVTEMLSSLVYQITLEVTDLQATVSPDTYTCTATVNPGPLETDLTASVLGSITLDVAVGEVSH